MITYWSWTVLGEFMYGEHFQQVAYFFSVGQGYGLSLCLVVGVPLPEIWLTEIKTRAF